MPASRSLLSFLVVCFVLCISSLLSSTWSNRQASPLCEITKNVYAAERPFIWNNIDVGGRSVIVNSEKKGLIVHSPIEFTPILGEALNNLGNDKGVSAVISPNYEHVKYADQWSKQFEGQAYMIACPGLPERLPDIKWSIELGHQTNVDVLEEFDWVYFDCEENPFTGTPFFNEVNLFHKPSKTLICADTFWNYPASDTPNYDMPGPSVEVPFGSRAWKFGMDRIYLPFYKNFMIRKAKKSGAYDRIMEKLFDWEIEIIAPCHGDIIRGKELCRQVLRKHFL